MVKLNSGKYSWRHRQNLDNHPWQRSVKWWQLPSFIVEGEILLALPTLPQGYTPQPR